MSMFSIGVIQADNDRILIGFRISDLNNAFNSNYYSQIAISTASILDGSKSMSGKLVTQWSEKQYYNDYIEFRYDSNSSGTELTEYDVGAFSLGGTYSVYAYAKSKDDSCWYRVGGSAASSQTFYVREPTFEFAYPDPKAETYPGCVDIAISNFYMYMSNRNLKRVGYMCEGTHYVKEVPDDAPKGVVHFHPEYTEGDTLEICACAETLDGRIWTIGHYVTFYIPPSSKPDPWDWNSSNGEASQADTYAAYRAFTDHSYTNKFIYTVWNDLVDKVKEVLEWKGNLNSEIGEKLADVYGDNISASATYEDLLDRAYVYSDDKTLYARKFNCLRYCIGSFNSTGVDLKIAKQSQVEGIEFYILTTKLNEIINQ